MAKKNILLSTTPTATTSTYFTEKLRAFYPEQITHDEDGNLLIAAKTVMPFDPTTGNTLMPVAIQGASGTAYRAAVVLQGVTGGVGGQQYMLSTSAVTTVANTSTSLFESQRTPTIYKSATIPAATGTTDVWTPSAGTKFRLMGYAIHFSGTAAAAGLRTFSIQQETLGDIGINTGTLAPAAGTGAENSTIVVNLPGNGYLATVADKKLQVVTGTTAYNVGADYISVWGTEE